ncbi:cleavage stimulation factor subunit 1 [Folsomia candida]|uniref:Cleavage stimulation factor 50 kDa subunit n=1 Tax=Folsomia candida TaxID=158441 RepID=A0A226E492_FOLCA|nr:cleavage stimulation factor subunit 1 [Folsomia candida]OXA52098.1 Cleavage stimulation factor subunit 1 [Folsomia candida]
MKEKEEMEVQDTRNKVKMRENLHKLIISQLFYDGFQQVAASLIGLTHPDSPCPPSDRLMHLVTLGLEQEQKQQGAKIMGLGVSSKFDNIGSGLDLESISEASTIAPEPASYETVYVTAHKAPCRTGAISKDGQLVATGSLDKSIKILSVERMLAKSSDIETAEPQGHPVIRTLYDHTEEVTCLEFHPKEQILISGSKDFTVRLFDYSRTSVKKAYKTLNESSSVTALSIHPTGDYLLVGTQHPVVRIYDINTSQCFVGSIPATNHTREITSLAWSSDGKMYVTASTDGSIKLWDGVSSRCVYTMEMAHDGMEVGSVTFSRNNKYILSSGKDSLVKLWELSTHRSLIAYTGAGVTGKQEFTTQAIFNHTEEYVVYPDEATISLCVWDARTASRQNLLSLGHNGPIRSIVHSHAGAGFLTCSEDFRARFWYRRMAPV